MKTNEKLAVFDFCETLIQFQTADAFINFVYEQTHSRRMRRVEKVKQLFYKTRIPRLFGGVWENRSLNKKWRLFELRGFSELELKRLASQFFQERLQPNLIGPVLAALEEKKQQGYTIGIVSSGFDVYINLFAAAYDVDFVLASTIGFKKGKCTGKLVGPDCMWAQKVKAIERLYPVPPGVSVSYSDNFSDLPILLWAAQGIVVSRAQHQQWIDQYKLDEIIWQP